MDSVRRLHAFKTDNNVERTLSCKQLYLFVDPGPELGVPGGFNMPGGVCAGLPNSVCNGLVAAGPSWICHTASLTDCSTALYVEKCIIKQSTWPSHVACIHQKHLREIVV